MSEALLANPEISNRIPATVNHGIAVRDARLGDSAFATRAFSAGDVLATGWGPISRERTKYTIQVDLDTHVVPPDPIRFLNHSCDPNCGLLLRSGVNRMEVHALREIEEGEELTLDYESFEMEFKVLTGPCLCLASTCRGKLHGYRAMPADRRAALGKYVAEYLREADVPVFVRSEVKAGS